MLCLVLIRLKTKMSVVCIGAMHLVDCEQKIVPDTRKGKRPDASVLLIR